MDRTRAPELAGSREALPYVPLRKDYEPSSRLASYARQEEAERSKEIEKSLEELSVLKTTSPVAQYAV